jgi:hypothetical protein
LVLVE